MGPKVKGEQQSVDPLEGLNLEDREALIQEIESRGHENSAIREKYLEEIRSIRSNLSGDRLRGKTQKIMRRFLREIEFVQSVELKEALEAEGEQAAVHQVATETEQRIDQDVSKFAEGVGKDDQSAQMEAAGVADEAKQEIGEIVDAIENDPSAEEPAVESVEQTETKENKLLTALLWKVGDLKRTSEMSDGKHTKEYSELAQTTKERLKQLAGQQFPTKAEQEQLLNLIFEEYREKMQAMATHTETDLEEPKAEGQAEAVEDNAVETEASEISNAREAYFKALRKRGDFVARGKKAEFDALERAYVKQSSAEINEQLAEFIDLCYS